MIIKNHHNGTILWQGKGCHPASFECDSCECAYHVTFNGTIERFDDFQTAENRFCELTDTKPFQLGKDKWE